MRYLCTEVSEKNYYGIVIKRKDLVRDEVSLFITTQRLRRQKEGAAHPLFVCSSAASRCLQNARS